MATLPHNLRNVTVVPTVSVMENFEALALKGDLADPTIAANGAGMVARNPLQAYPDGTVGGDLNDLTGPRDTGFVSSLLAATPRQPLVVDEIFPSGFNPATTNAGAYINQVMDWGVANGNHEVTLRGRRYAVSTAVQIPDGVELRGLGRTSTELFLLAGANVNLVQKKGGAAGVGVALKNLALNGNDANNTAGGLYWAGPSSGRGPSLTIENVLVNFCRPAAGSGTNGAVVFEGAVWGEVDGLDITSNQHSIGLWHKASDWTFDRLYLGPNGATANGGVGGQNMILQGGAGNIFKSPYFGGNGGFEQVLLWGAQRNIFMGAINDNAWESAYRFADNGGAASNNMFIGGQIGQSGGKTNNTFPAISLEGAASGNIFASIFWFANGHTSSGNKSNYAISESGTAGNNHLIGGVLSNSYGTGFKNLRAAGGSSIQNVAGYNGEGIAAITVTASPFTYTNQDHVLQAVYVSGGTVSAVAKQSQTIFAASNCSVVLAPGESMTVTYTVAPTMFKDRK